MEQMQNEFENFACKELMDISKKYGDSYRDIRTHYAWLAWQASRQAVEIDLPMPAYSRESIQAVAMHRVLLCKKAITDAGLRIKQR